MIEMLAFFIKVVKYQVSAILLDFLRILAKIAIN